LLRITAIVAVGRLRTLRRLIRAAAVGIARPVAVVTGRRGTRRLAVGKCGLPTTARPWRTVRIVHARGLRRHTRSGAIGASEPGRSATAIRCTSLRFPGAWAVAGARRRGVAHNAGGRSVGVGHRRRRPILREFLLTASYARVAGHG